MLCTKAHKEVSESMSERMRLKKTGWETGLELESVDVTEPKGDQIRIEVEACGVCYRDLVDRSGRFPFIRLPITPGHEVVGKVAAIGPDVTDWAVGDRVAAMHRDFCGSCPPCRAGETSFCARAMALPGLLIDGGYQQHMVAPQRCFYRMPQSIPKAEAAILHCTFGTVFRSLTVATQVQTGQQVFVTGANGGVGTAAIQVANRLGAEVTAIVRDERYGGALEKLGANRIIVDADGRFHKKTGGKQADVVVVCVGTPTFNPSLRSLCPGGTVVVIGNVVKDKAALNLGYLITHGSRIVSPGSANRTDMENLLAFRADRPFDVQVHAEMALSEADQAQRDVKAGGLLGRIVLVP